MWIGNKHDRNHALLRIYCWWKVEMEVSGIYDCTCQVDESFLILGSSVNTKTVYQFSLLHCKHYSRVDCWSQHSRFPQSPAELTYCSVFVSSHHASSVELAKIISTSYPMDLKHMWKMNTTLPTTCKLFHWWKILFGGENL